MLWEGLEGIWGHLGGFREAFRGIWETLGGSWVAFRDIWVPEEHPQEATGRPKPVNPQACHGFPHPPPSTPPSLLAPRALYQLQSRAKGVLSVIRRGGYATNGRVETLVEFLAKSLS